MRKLFGYFRSSAAFRVRIALGLKGLAYEHASINLKPGVSEQKADSYKALNPQGRVPFLVDGDVL
ncbi:MAG: glutathione S-transferase N-terminal domain-containing protein, partial [Kordiimonadaceae bacterium]|nr:glutathione S-transferase N-terminal domain-containing protein [Kordiimonadaceae bacterium]